FRGEQLDLHELAPAITAPTLVLTGTQDLISPPRIAHDLAARIPGARLLEVPGARHSILDTRSRILQLAARWSASATARRPPARRTAHGPPRRTPRARLLGLPGPRHSILDTRSRILQVAARWSACGTAHRLPERAEELAALPASATDLALTRGLQIALAAERLSPWRLRLASARAEREWSQRAKAQIDPRPHLGRRGGIDRADPV